MSECFLKKVSYDLWQFLKDISDRWWLSSGLPKHMSISYGTLLGKRVFTSEIKDDK